MSERPTLTLGLKRQDFDTCFYKMPSYIRRAATAEAIGKVSSYKSNLANWEAADPYESGQIPSYSKAGFIYPSLYKGNMYQFTGTYKAKIKVYIRNTWDWVSIDLKKSDMDYIKNHCSGREMKSPTLRKRGKEWFLEFPFEEEVKLNKTDIHEQRIVAVDLGINSPATVSVMRADGTVLGRHFLKLPKEYDSFTHSVNRIKKAQQHGSRKAPKLWAKAKGINDNIAVKTAQFIMDIAVLYNADVIVFEHLDLNGRKRGSKKQKLNLWKRKNWINIADSPKVTTWKGLAFENVCWNHIKQIKTALEIGGVSTEESLWSKKGDKDSEGTQIDLIIERKDNVVNMCESKFYSESFSVDKDYHLILEKRKKLLYEVIPKKASVHNILITTYGLTHNEYYGDFVRVVTLDDLFG